MDTKAEIAVEKIFIKFRLGTDKMNQEILQAYHYKYQRLVYPLSLLDVDNTPYKMITNMMNCYSKDL